jgi:preprotein translocase subunit YajC
MFASVAHAMGSAGGSGGSGDALMQFMPLILMLVIFYFLLIRPQQKRAKEHKAMLQALKKGDTVITNAGLIGRIVDIYADILLLDLGATRVQLGRGYVAGLTNIKLNKPGGRKDSKKEARDADQDEFKTEDGAESSDAEENAPRDPDRVDKA